MTVMAIVLASLHMIIFSDTALSLQKPVDWDRDREAQLHGKNR